MGYDKRHLMKLVLLVDKVYNSSDDKDFAAGINAIVLNRLAITTNEEIETVRKALELRSDLSIDYSFVKDIFVLRQLMIDNLRMENVLMNLSMPEIERYENFCISAFLQVENILNYYFCEKYNKNIDSILTEIERITENDRYPFKRNPKITYLYVSDIPIAYKIQAFCDKFFPYDPTHLDFTSKILQELRKMRNDIFHRAGEKRKGTGKDAINENKTEDPTAAMFRDTLKKVAFEVDKQLKKKK